MSDDKRVLIDPVVARPVGRDPMERALVGPAGEHYVLYRLHRLGLLASLAPRGAPTVDILVLSPDEQVIATIQVKARTKGPDRGWPMNVKHEEISAPRYFYALVDFEPSQPVTYIVPSVVVADFVKKSHAAWLNTPGAGGRAHRDNVMRRVQPAPSHAVPGYLPDWLDRYQEAWGLIQEATGGQRKSG